jgi:uncharacterized phage-associated protein
MASVQALCNTILKKSFDEAITVTPMKLQKLLYFTYKEYLRRTGKKLFVEPFQVWQYGPVLGSVYDEFKTFRGNRITHFAKDATGNVFILDDTKISMPLQSLNVTWEKFKYYSGNELSELTHRPESAWQNARNKDLCVLLDEDIKNEPEFTR